MKENSKSATLQLSKTLLSLYDTSTYSDEVVEQLYKEDATFGDPLMEVRGIDNIKAQFRGMKTMVVNSKATLSRGSLSGGETLTIESQMVFCFKPFPKWMQLHLQVFSICELDESKIICHTDHWALSSIIESIPLVSFLYKRFRPTFGSFSSAVLKRIRPEHAHES